MDNRPKRAKWNADFNEPVQDQFAPKEAFDADKYANDLLDELPGKK